MKKVIGIVGEGPTDYLVIKEVIDFVSGEENTYIRLQPEPNLQGKFGNGWKGVWKWCEDTAPILEKIFCDITPKMDMLVVQMDADVSRKEKEVHCLCKSIAILVNNAFKAVQQSAKDKEDICRRADARQRYLTQDFTL